jgi:UrcA family protein
MKNIICAALAASIMLCAFQAAQAQEAQMRVKLAGVNLATDAGARTALARIAFSAANFCEKSTGRQTLERATVTDRCVAEMTAKSVRQLNAPLVTALLESGGKTAQPAQYAMAQ